jgi:CubicO group peptidase (beta-lactamase class C family)
MSDDFGALEGFVLEKMRESRTPGLSISIVADNRVKYTRAFGFRDLSSGLPATSRTLYGIGSVTKSFTALSIMQLVGEGKLSLDDSVEKHVPGTPRPFGEAPTIHDLLTHSSGLPALGYGEAFISGVLGFDHSWLPVSSAEDVITFMRDATDWAVSKPGKRFFYLNEGYVLLGYIIAKVGKSTYEAYLRKRVLRPLGMDRTFISRPDVEKDNDRATPYIVDKEGKHIPSGAPYGISSDGGIISNVLDLSNYVRMCLNRGRFDGKSIVGKKLFEAMEQPHMRLPYEYFGKEAYGYGWSITPNFYGHKLIDHSGSVGVYTAYVGYIPEKKVGVAVLGNPSKYSASNIGMFALAQLLGVDPETLPYVKQDRILEKLQGEYETYKGTMKINVKKKGDFLIAEMKDKYTEEATPLIPQKLEEDHATFYTFSEGTKLTTEFSVRNGKVEWIFERYKALKKG